MGLDGSNHLDLVAACLQKPLHNIDFPAGAAGNDVVKIGAYHIHYTKRGRASWLLALGSWLCRRQTLLMRLLTRFVGSSLLVNSSQLVFLWLYKHNAESSCTKITIASDWLEALAFWAQKILLFHRSPKCKFTRDQLFVWWIYRVLLYTVLYGVKYTCYNVRVTLSGWFLYALASVV